MTVAQRLAAHAVQLRYDELPVEVVHGIKDVLLHDLAVGIGASREPESERAVAFARHAGIELGTATIIGHRRLASPIDAAFANAVIMRAWRQEDTMHPFGLHPGPIILPAALALGESRGTAGRDLIAAVAAGYDVIAALAGGQGSNAEMAYRTPSHVFGAFATAATAARLLELDVSGVATALAYAANLAIAISVGFDNHNYGLVVRNGMTAAYLGQAGAPARAETLAGPGGFFEAALGLDADRLEEQLTTLGERHPVLNTVCKPHPCTGANLASFALVRRIIRRAGLTGADVAEVAVRIGRQMWLVPGLVDAGPWPDVFRQISSLRYGIGCILVDGEVARSRLLALNDPAVSEASRRVQVSLHREAERTDVHVTIRTVTGASYDEAGDFTVTPKTDSAGILEREADGRLGTGRAAEILHSIEHLEHLDSVAELTQLLRPA